MSRRPANAPPVPTQLNPDGSPKIKRPVGPKVVYLLVANEEIKAGILGVFTNPRDLVNGLENNSGSRSVKLTLPQREKAEVIVDKSDDQSVTQPV